MASSATAPATPTTFAYAAVLRRIAAYLIDLLILFSAFKAMSFTMRAFRATGLWAPAVASPEYMWRAMSAGHKLLILIAMLLSCGALYSALFHSSPWQATYGKRLLNIYVADDNGQRITFRRALVRWVYLWFSWWFLIWVISLIMVAFSRNHKALHDLPGTLVLSGEPADRGSLESWRVICAFGVPFVWSAAAFMISL